MTAYAGTVASPIVLPALQAWMQRRYGRLRNRDKIAGRELATTPKTARNWRTGTTSPRAEELIRAARACPDLRRELYRLIEQG